MTQPNYSPDIEPVYELLARYSFDTEAYLMEAVIAGWLDECGPVWVSHAITEALYQGRYKVVSIDHILKLWQRRGQPIRHFSREFESIILGQALLCPTGYGDGAEIQAPAKVSPAVVPATEQIASPLEESSPPEPQSQKPGSEVTPPQANPFSAAAIAPSADVTFRRGGIPNFRPLVPDLDAVWPQAEEIQPFVPRQDSSELHQRLRAVVKGGMRE